jgi:nucleotidyltransferase substrate binding protein (TIGR01987 family)
MNNERLLEKLEDYKHACRRLDEATKIKLDDDIVYDGVIQRFEFTFELSWKLMKAFLGYKGISEVKSPRDTIREAFSYGLIEDGEKWIDMMVDRNKTSHMYDEEEARLIYKKIKNEYHLLLMQLAVKMENELNSETGN